MFHCLGMVQGNFPAHENLKLSEKLYKNASSVITLPLRQLQEILKFNFSSMQFML